MSLISDALQKVQAEWAQRVGKVSIPHYGSILPSAGKDSWWINPTARRRVAMALAVIVGIPAIALLIITWISGSQVAKHPPSRVTTMPPPSTLPIVQEPAVIVDATTPPNETKNHDALLNTSPTPETTLPRVTEPAMIPQDVGSITPTRENDPPLRGKAIAVTHQPEEASAPMKAEALALFRSGVSAQKDGDDVRAKEFYRQSLRIDPTNVAAHNNLGTVYKNTNNLPAAIDAYRKELWLDPEFDEARINLAAALFERGKLDDAAEELTTVLANAPNTLKAHAILGAVYTRLHREDEAIHAFQRTLSFDPNLPEAHYNLGLLLEQAGAVPEAIKHFRRFIEVSDGQHPEALKTVFAHLDRLNTDTHQQ